MNSHLFCWLNAGEHVRFREPLKLGIAFVLFCAHPLSSQSVSCSAVTRGDKTTCTASGGAHYKNWGFSDGSYGVSRGAVDSPVWQGMLVKSGHVSVDIYSASGGITTVSTVVNPAPRSTSQFALVPTSPVQQPSGYACSPALSLDLPSPPNTAGSGDGIEGKFCSLASYSYNSAAVTDGGPNQGYWYITSLQSNTKYFWAESPDLLDVSSDFFRAQCGNFNPNTQQGFISGSQLAVNTVHHESGNTTSHYANWLSALAGAENPGALFESAVYKAPSSTGFQNYVTQITQNSIDQLGYLAAAKPCTNGDLVNLDASCIFRGNINYKGSGTVYASCN